MSSVLAIVKYIRRRRLESSTESRRELSVAQNKRSTNLLTPVLTVLGELPDDEAPFADEIQERPEPV